MTESRDICPVCHTEAQVPGKVEYNGKIFCGQKCIRKYKNKPEKKDTSLSDFGNG